MSAYRTITMPKCPYCGAKQDNQSPFNDNWSLLVGMAMGTRSNNVILKCEKCGKKFRVTCNIRFYGRKIIEGR